MSDPWSGRAEAYRSSVTHATDADLEAYLAKHSLPNEWDYFDPAKADEKRECGLHAAWGKQAVSA